MSDRSNNDDLIALHDGRILIVHSRESCQLTHCCVHNPSTHHMLSWPHNWRGDRGIMERMCTHGIGHPDPDDFRVVMGSDSGIHGCDGCCREEIVGE